MIDYTYKDLYNRDSIKKQLVIAFDGGQITNSDLYSESFELMESLCSESELRFGSCEASVLKFKIANTVTSLKNKVLTVSQILSENTDETFQFGKYKVYSDVPSGDRNYRNVTAYDSMYDIINADVAAWYESLVFPITQKEFRDSFFEYFGITQVEVELILDDMLIEKTISATSISGKDIITAICELNGVFGHINRQGNFVYVSLADKTGEILYPKIDLYPSSSLYSATTPYSSTYHSEIFNGSKYISCEYEDFETNFITKLQIRQEENDIGAVVGDGTNTYIIEDNFLVYGKTAEELEEIAGRILNKIKTVQYRPFKAALRGNPCLEVGDAVVFHTRYKDVEGYILERTLKGIQSLKDTFQSEGVYEYEEKVNSVQRDVKRLKGKTNVLERTVEKLDSIITDEENGLQTQVQQTAEGLKTKVSKGDVSSEISQESDLIEIKGNRISIKSDYFELTEDGVISAKGGIFEGVFRQYTSNGIKSVEILDNQVAVYAWHDNGNYVGSFGALRREESDGTVRGMVSMWCDYEDILTLNYKSPTDSNKVKSVFTFDPVDMENGHTPWIKNTASGTLFSSNPSGGITVENGLIKKWSLSGKDNYTLFPNNPSGGILFMNGLAVSGGVTRVANSTLNAVTGVYINGEGLISALQFTKIEVKDGLFISWTTETRNITGGWMT